MRGTVMVNRLYQSQLMADDALEVGHGPPGISSGTRRNILLTSELYCMGLAKIQAHIQTLHTFTRSSFSTDLLTRNGIPQPPILQGKPPF